LGLSASLPFVNFVSQSASNGMFLRFSEHCAFSGMVLALPGAAFANEKPPTSFFDLLGRFLSNRF
jgi:hypothetical protein